MHRPFYERLHSENRVYGLSSYDMDRLFDRRGFVEWARRAAPAGVRILDVGCGKGQFLVDLSAALQKRFGMKLTRVAALDLVRAVPNVLAEITPEPEFFQQSVEGEALPFTDQSFDFIACNHVIEHIFETEQLLREIRRIVSDVGLVVISVPNVAAWMNRIAFLFGGQPLGSEVGTEKVTYGFWPGSLKPRLEQFVPSGHIRGFTPSSLRDLCTACGFDQVGWWAQNGGLLPRLNPRLSRNLGILLRPK